MRENKFAVLFGCFIVGNFIHGQLLATGAFEVSLGDKVLWSKLATGQVPDYEQIVLLLRRHGIQPVYS